MECTTQATTTEAATTEAPTTQAPTIEAGTTTANPCSLQGFEWTAWTECAKGSPCGIGISERRQEVVTGTGTACTKKTDFETRLCYMECTTQSPTTEATTTQAPTTQTPTTEAGTTTVNPCSLQGFEWTAWTKCAHGSPCGIGISQRRQEVVTGIGTACTKETNFETRLCGMECTTQSPTTEATTTQAPTTQTPTTVAPTTQAPTTEASTTQDPTTQAPTTEAATTTVNPCPLQGFEWTAWTECAKGSPCELG